MTTGVGFNGDFSKAKFRTYRVGSDKPTDPLPIDPGPGGKGSLTSYTGPQPTGPVLRTGRDISTTYDEKTGTMHVHLYNFLTPVEAGPPTVKGQ